MRGTGGESCQLVQRNSPCGPSVIEWRMCCRAGEGWVERTGRCGPGRGDGGSKGKEAGRPEGGFLKGSPPGARP